MERYAIEIACIMKICYMREKMTIMKEAMKLANGKNLFSQYENFPKNLKAKAVIRISKITSP